MQCAVCGAAAKTKCTKCGQLFCGLHVRHGNPHYAFSAVQASAGNYCDTCWQSYADLSAKRTRWSFLGGWLMLILFALFICFILGNMIMIWNR